MKIHYIERGRYMGRIDVPKSLSTMEPGEIWHLNPTVVNIRSIRNCCYLASRDSEKIFSASCPGYSEPCITIKRIK